MTDDNQATRKAMAVMKVQLDLLQQKNEALHASMESIHQQQHDKDESNQDEDITTAIVFRWKSWSHRGHHHLQHSDGDRWR